MITTLISLAPLIVLMPNLIAGIRHTKTGEYNTPGWYLDDHGRRHYWNGYQITKSGILQ